MKKAAVVTGATAGIGEATAKRLIERDSTTYAAAARRLDRMAKLEKLGAILLPLHLTEHSSIVQAAERIRAEQGHIAVRQLPSPSPYLAASPPARVPSQLADDLHEVVDFSVRGRLADFQVLLHGDAGKEGQDHLRELRWFHRGLLGFDISRDQIFEKRAAR
jgi:NADP-dependent 3-hydroxy acid dehydrogenase YdfG